jgi:hypothetical protein
MPGGFTCVHITNMHAIVTLTVDVVSRRKNWAVPVIIVRR